jgi:hypothetical protein
MFISFVPNPIHQTAIDTYERTNLEMLAFVGHVQGKRETYRQNVKKALVVNVLESW